MNKSKTSKSEAPTSVEARTPLPPPSLFDYATAMITARLDKMLSFTEGVRAHEETEPVHQMRVWSRRSRAALEVFRDCFPGKAYAELEREVKAITDALGESRDLDVMIESLQKRAETLPLEQRSGIDSFIDRLKKRRETSQEPVVRAIERLEKHDLATHFATLVAAHSAPRATTHHAANGNDADG